MINFLSAKTKAESERIFSHLPGRLVRHIEPEVFPGGILLGTAAKECVQNIDRRGIASSKTVILKIIHKKAGLVNDIRIYQVGVRELQKVIL
ncbi:MAG: hypothetical protein KF831_09925 [Acidobacteria bacterium]|nr:hypothetical protein [Acidobacteriota bacterium]